MPQIHHLLTLNKLFLAQYNHKWHSNNKSLLVSTCYHIFPILRRFWLSRFFVRCGVICLSSLKVFIQRLLYYIGLRPLLSVFGRHAKLLLILLCAQLLWHGLFARGYHYLSRLLFHHANPHMYYTRSQHLTAMHNAPDYLSWARSAVQLDDLDGILTWKQDNASEHYDWQRLERFCSILLNLYFCQNSRAIMLFLQAHLRRNFCNILAPQLYNVLTTGTKQLIEDYIQLTLHSIQLVAQDTSIPIRERLTFIRQISYTYGRSCIMLSGGASFAILHAGVLIELVRAGFLPAVISGASGGSIIAAAICWRTDREIIEVLEQHPDHIYTQFYYPEKLTTTQSHIFPKPPDTTSSSSYALFDVRQLRFACQQIVPANMTFLDAFHYSGGRIYNVVIHSPSLASGFLVMNYLTAPHVYVWSAVAASCSLPGVFDPCPVQYSETYTKLILAYLRGTLNRYSTNNTQHSPNTMSKHGHYNDGDDDNDEYHPLGSGSISRSLSTTSSSTSLTSNLSSHRILGAISHATSHHHHPHTSSSHHDTHNQHQGHSTTQSHHSNITSHKNSRNSLSTTISRDPSTLHRPSSPSSSQGPSSLMYQEGTSSQNHQQPPAPIPSFCNATTAALYPTLCSAAAPAADSTSYGATDGSSTHHHRTTTAANAASPQIFATPMHLPNSSSFTPQHQSDLPSAVDISAAHHHSNTHDDQHHPSRSHHRHDHHHSKSHASHRSTNNRRQDQPSSASSYHPSRINSPLHRPSGEARGGGSSAKFTSLNPHLVSGEFERLFLSGTHPNASTVVPPLPGSTSISSSRASYSAAHIPEDEKHSGNHNGGGALSHASVPVQHHHQIGAKTQRSSRQQPSFVPSDNRSISQLDCDDEQSLHQQQYKLDTEAQTDGEQENPKFFTMALAPASSESSSDNLSSSSVSRSPQQRPSTAAHSPNSASNQNPSNQPGFLKRQRASFHASGETSSPATRRYSQQNNRHHHGSDLIIQDDFSSTIPPTTIPRDESPPSKDDHSQHHATAATTTSPNSLYPHSSRSGSSPQHDESSHRDSHPARSPSAYVPSASQPLYLSALQTLESGSGIHSSSPIHVDREYVAPTQHKSSTTKSINDLAAPSSSSSPPASCLPASSAIISTKFDDPSDAIQMPHQANAQPAVHSTTTPCSTLTPSSITHSSQLTLTSAPSPSPCVVHVTGGSPLVMPIPSPIPHEVSTLTTNFTQPVVLQKNGYAVLAAGPTLPPTGYISNSFVTPHQQPEPQQQQHEQQLSTHPSSAVSNFQTPHQIASSAQYQQPTTLITPPQHNSFPNPQEQHTHQHATIGQSPHPHSTPHGNSPHPTLLDSNVSECDLTQVHVSEAEHESLQQLFADDRLYADGSLGADLPYTVLKEQFNCNFSLVSQVNPHVAPLLKCFPSYQTSDYTHRAWAIPLVENAISLMLTITQYLLQFFRNYISNCLDTTFLSWYLPRFMMPMVQTLRSMLSQTYAGDVTLLPPKLTWKMYSRVISNPTTEELVDAIASTRRHIWRYLTRIKVGCAIEQKLNELFHDLQQQQQKERFEQIAQQHTALLRWKHAQEEHAEQLKQQYQQQLQQQLQQHPSDSISTAIALPDTNPNQLKPAPYLTRFSTTAAATTTPHGTHAVGERSSSPPSILLPTGPTSTAPISYDNNQSMYNTSSIQQQHASDNSAIAPPIFPQNLSHQTSFHSNPTNTQYVGNNISSFDFSSRPNSTFLSSSYQVSHQVSRAAILHPSCSYKFTTSSGGGIHSISGGTAGEDPFISPGQSSLNSSVTSPNGAMIKDTPQSHGPQSHGPYTMIDTLGTTSSLPPSLETTGQSDQHVPMIFSREDQRTGTGGNARPRVVDDSVIPKRRDPAVVTTIEEHIPAQTQSKPKTVPPQQQPQQPQQTRPPTQRPHQRIPTAQATAAAAYQALQERSRQELLRKSSFLGSKYSQTPGAGNPQNDTYNSSYDDLSRVVEGNDSSNNDDEDDTDRPTHFGCRDTALSHHNPQLAHGTALLNQYQSFASLNSFPSNSTQLEDGNGDRPNHHPHSGFAEQHPDDNADNYDQQAQQQHPHRGSNYHGDYFPSASFAPWQSISQMSITAAVPLPQRTLHDAAEYYYDIDSVYYEAIDDDGDETQGQVAGANNSAGFDNVISTGTLQSHDSSQHPQSYHVIHPSSKNTLLFINPPNATAVSQLHPDGDGDHPTSSSLSPVRSASKAPMIALPALSSSSVQSVNNTAAAGAAGMGSAASPVSPRLMLPIQRLASLSSIPGLGVDQTMGKTTVPPIGGIASISTNNGLPPGAYEETSRLAAQAVARNGVLGRINSGASVTQSSTPVLLQRNHMSVTGLHPATSSSSIVMEHDSPHIHKNHSTSGIGTSGGADLLPQSTMTRRSSIYRIRASFGTSGRMQTSGSSVGIHAAAGGAAATSQQPQHHHQHSFGSRGNIAQHYPSHNNLHTNQGIIVPVIAPNGILTPSMEPMIDPINVHLAQSQVPNGAATTTNDVPSHGLSRNNLRSSGLCLPVLPHHGDLTSTGNPRIGTAFNPDIAGGISGLQLQVPTDHPHQQHHHHHQQMQQQQVQPMVSQPQQQLSLQLPPPPPPQQHQQQQQQQQQWEEDNCLPFSPTVDFPPSIEPIDISSSSSDVAAAAAAAAAAVSLSHLDKQASSSSTKQPIIHLPPPLRQQSSLNGSIISNDATLHHPQQIPSQLFQPPQSSSQLGEFPIKQPFMASSTSSLPQFAPQPVIMQHNSQTGSIYPPPSHHSSVASLLPYPQPHIAADSHSNSSFGYMGKPPPSSTSFLPSTTSSHFASQFHTPVPPPPPLSTALSFKQSASMPVQQRPPYDGNVLTNIVAEEPLMTPANSENNALTNQ